MADNARNYIGIAMGLDVTDLKAGLQETRKEISTANKKFAAETSGLDNWTKSADGLKAKLEQLGTTLKNQRKNVAGIQAELDHAKEAYGENSEQVRVLTDKLYDAQAALSKTQKAQRKYGAMLGNLTSETHDAEKATDGLSDSLKETEDAADNVRGGFTVLKGALAGLVASGITALVSGLKSAVEESREFRRELSYLEQAAEDAGVSFDKAKDKVADVYAIFGEEDSAVEGINNLMTAGFDGAALDTITDQLAGAAIKWHDTLKFEGLSDGLQETLATGKAIGPFVELLERSGIVAEEFDAEMAALSTTAERQQYVMDTLSSLGLEGVTSGYREANKSLIESEKAQFRYNETMGQVGERVEPVFTTIKQGWADVLTAALVSTQGIDLEALRTNIQNAFSWFIDEAIPLIKEFVSYVIENKDTILGAIVGVGAAFAAWKVTSIVQGCIAVYKLWAKETELLTLKQKLLNLAMKMNPIGLVVSLIAGLVAAFITLWNTSDEFRNFWIGLWNKIKAAAQPVLSYIGQAFSKVWDGIKKVWSVVADWFKGVWNKIKSVFNSNTVRQGIVTPFSNAWNAIKAVWGLVTSYFRLIWSNIRGIFSVVKSVLSGDFRGAWEGIKSIWDNTKSYFSGIIDTIFGYFSELPDKLISVGRDMIDGLVQGVKNAAGRLADAARNAVNGAIEAAKSFLQTGSPSRKTAKEIGLPMGQGIGVGLLESAKTVARDMDKFNQNLQGKLSNIKDGISVPSTAPTAQGIVGGGAVTNNYTQIINAPKQPSRIELYRDTKNLLAMRGLRNV